MSKLLDKVSVYVDKYLSTRIVFLIDTISSVLSSVLTLVFLLSFTQPGGMYHSTTFIVGWLFSALVFTIVSLMITRSYRIIIRHSTTKDYGKQIATAALKDIGMCIIAIFVVTKHTGAYVALIADFTITFMVLVITRVMMAYAYDAIFNRVKSDEKQQRVLVYGLSDKSVAIITRLLHSPHYKVIGFFTPQSGTKSFSLSELPIYHYENSEDALEICQKLRVKSILFATVEEARQEHSDLINHLSTNGIKILIAPSIDEIPA
ncbi:MAG: hypothetical protein IJS07_05700, partial [Bacteroidales bacterium]|nr:hypothetical protein [Bacteroidales bacterium]